ncbi:hypothetical protein F5I97DRAFT_1832502 [Phlebopus sp. FC_14]|nr:hypothetical protein F5I97DRAFT_1832502 [Phlebopus sp. FC_14]
MVGLATELAEWMTQGSDDGSSDEEPPEVNIPSSSSSESAHQVILLYKEPDDWYNEATLWKIQGGTYGLTKRHAFSISCTIYYMNVILWGLVVLGINNVPSSKVLKDVDALLQCYCGVETMCYEGWLRHIYYANSLASLIAQEMANLTVQPHLRHYPEDIGKHLSTIKGQGLGLCLWCLTNPMQGNRWHLQSQGHHVLTFMM